MQGMAWLAVRTRCIGESSPPDRGERAECARLGLSHCGVFCALPLPRRWRAAAVIAATTVLVSWCSASPALLPPPHKLATYSPQHLDARSGRHRSRALPRRIILTPPPPPPARSMSKRLQARRVVASALGESVFDTKGGAGGTSPGVVTHVGKKQRCWALAVLWPSVVDYRRGKGAMPEHSESSFARIRTDTPA